mmetsp:Transcript_14136/g.31564  ORF Transcript_14136/g.31564 Transcript_14136/m.31564 type:complete len:244 (+) Transcript_14136:689-1420(+)
MSSESFDFALMSLAFPDEDRSSSFPKIRRACAALSLEDLSLSSANLALASPDTIPFRSASNCEARELSLAARCCKSRFFCSSVNLYRVRSSCSLTSCIVLEDVSTAAMVVLAVFWRNGTAFRIPTSKRLATFSVKSLALSDRSYFSRSFASPKTAQAAAISENEEASASAVPASGCLSRASAVYFLRSSACESEGIAPKISYKFVVAASAAGSPSLPPVPVPVLLLLVGPGDPSALSESELLA